MNGGRGGGGYGGGYGGGMGNMGGGMGMGGGQGMVSQRASHPGTWVLDVCSTTTCSQGWA